MCNTIKKYIYIILKNSSHNYHHPQNYLTQIIGYKKRTKQKKKSNILLPSNHHYNAVTQSLPIREVSNKLPCNVITAPPSYSRAILRTGGDVTPLEKKLAFYFTIFRGKGGNRKKNKNIQKYAYEAEVDVMWSIWHLYYSVH